jgi:hypothetical protein
MGSGEGGQGGFQLLSQLSLSIIGTLKGCSATCRETFSSTKDRSTVDQPTFSLDSALYAAANCVVSTTSREHPKIRKRDQRVGSSE